MDTEEYIVACWVRRDDMWGEESRSYSSINGREIVIALPTDALYPTIRLVGSQG